MYVFHFVSYGHLIIQRSVVKGDPLVSDACLGEPLRQFGVLSLRVLVVAALLLAKRLLLPALLRHFHRLRFQDRVVLKRNMIENLLFLLKC